MSAIATAIMGAVTALLTALGKIDIWERIFRRWGKNKKLKEIEDEIEDIKNFKSGRDWTDYFRK